MYESGDKMATKSVIYMDEMESPIGLLTIGKSEKGICFIHFGRLKKDTKMNASFMKRFQDVLYKKSEIQLVEAVKQLNEYFSGERKTFDLPLDLIGTPFQLSVWSKLTEIPYGETRSYKQIATDIGSPKAVRAIGGANNKNPVPIIIPCHRVIGSNGSLVGYGGGLEKKQYLLHLEGVLEKMSS